MTFEEYFRISKEVKKEYIAYIKSKVLDIMEIKDNNECIEAYLSKLIDQFSSFVLLICKSETDCTINEIKIDQLIMTHSGKRLSKFKTKFEDKYVIAFCSYEDELILYLFMLIRSYFGDCIVEKEKVNDNE